MLQAQARLGEGQQRHAVLERGTASLQDLIAAAEGRAAEAEGSAIELREALAAAGAELEAARAQHQLTIVSVLCLNQPEGILGGLL